jgi:hypothetical protein
MLSLKECTDFCGLTDDELMAIEHGAHVTPVGACALAQAAEENPKDCRQVLKYMQEYLAYVEDHADTRRAHEVHEAIQHFASTHHFV